MRLRIFSTFALTGLLWGGCAFEETPMEGGSIVAVMEDIQTRTSVTDEGSFTWSSGDKVWLEITSSPGYVTGTLSSGAGTGSACFAYGTYFGEMTGNAVYPFNTGHDISGDQLSVVLPASYDLGSSLSNTNAAMYGIEVSGKLKFNHLAGVMRFKFRNVPAGTDRFVLTLDKKINGTFIADLTADLPVLETEATDVDSEKSVTLNFDALPSTQDIMLYVPLPLGTYTSLGLEVKAGTKSVWSYSNTVTNTIRRKSLILMPTVTLAGSIDGDIEGEETPEEAVNLSENGTANSYIVFQKGAYKFSTVKGNSSESVGVVTSAEVLWESFGTDVTPNLGDLIKSVSYKNGEITFQTADSFKEGNAVIAAKDASGNILWSWHIWLTDEPEGQVYNNNAGTMMDRNLGAISATPGDVGALGLLYQWGRKDPFLGSSSISSNTLAKSTGTWPSTVSSDVSNGTIEYATANPTTFITWNESNYDWYYTGDSSTDNTRWTESSSEKTIYDPCPAGWRVPDGGEDGIWSKTLGSSSQFDNTFSSTDKGMNFSGMLGSASTIWYPASGRRTDAAGILDVVGSYGYCWSASPADFYAYFLAFGYGGGDPSLPNNRAYGLSVRCVKEGSTSPTPSEPGIINLSNKGLANSYIVSEAGSYKIVPTKGNSNESVGTISSVEVLWESFGTDVTPNIGDLIKSVSYDGNIVFQTADTFKEGNAVIAAKDASGNILWSWHIWLTDEPQGQEYYNNAGTMMDRNIGATSATPGDVGALGLLYQWGRKDPFLGSSSISSSTIAKSTVTWPSAVSSDSSTGTIAYATTNPTTFITYNESNYDWYYTGSESTDNTRWTTSESSKSIYDPCPAGWRVPDGGSNGVWSTALGSSSSYNGTYDSTNKGMNFSGKFGSASTIWYPASGYLNFNAGSLYFVGLNGYYWSASPLSHNAYFLYLFYDGSVSSDNYYRACGHSVRCVRE